MKLLFQRDDILWRGMWCTCVLFVSLHVAAAQQTIERVQEVEQQFNEALSLYRKGDFDQASAAFERIATRMPNHQRTTAAWVMKAKSELYSGKYDESDKTLHSFLKNYPSSTYKGDAEFTLGLVYLGKQLPGKALDEFVKCWRSIDNRPNTLQLYRLLLATIDSTVEHYASLEDLRRTSEGTQGSEREFFLLALAKRQLGEGQYAEAMATIDVVEGETRPLRFPDRLRVLRQRLTAPREVRIGVLLPLMKKSAQPTREKEVGTELLDGITFAFEEYSQRHSARIVSLDVRDSEGDPAGAAVAFRGFTEDALLIGVIGPAFSSEAIAVRRLANEHRIPTITPTANANGIAESGFFVFQANPDFVTRGKAMARHAVRTMKLTRLAILASREPTSKALAEAFEREALDLGATVISTEWYDRGVTDLTQQLLHLRRKANAFAQEPYVFFEKLTQKDIGKLSKLGVPQKALDSLVYRRSVANVAHFLGESAAEMLKENGIPFIIGDPRIDSLQRIVTSIQGLYCPISSPAEIGVISSQLAYFGLETTLLGSGEWNSIAELSANKRYIRSVVFESDSYIDTKDLRVRDFMFRFSNKFGRMPSRNDYYGYDVARLVLSAFDQGASAREQLQNALEQIKSYPALHAKISLTPRRVNSWLHILQYANETIQRIAEIEIE